MRLQTSCAHCGSAERASLVDRIVGNSTLTRAQLAKLDIHTLQVFDEVFANASRKTADYSGRPMAVAPYANTAENKKLAAAARPVSLVEIFQKNAAPPSLNRQSHWPAHLSEPSLHTNKTDAELAAALRQPSMVEIFSARAKRVAL